MPLVAVSINHQLQQQNGMKYKQFILILAITIIAVTLSACAGGATQASSWPGLIVDEQYAYVAYNTQVYAVDLVNGTEKWRYPGEPDNNITFYSNPSLSESGQLIVGGYDGVLEISWYAGTD